ncbi:helix-turn-helix domain-containing protein [Cohnella sp. CFH 77786]|uniref:AraC family transcriptional regulator n=1 Tax=Cohnella sp. CFH 77786 TaxID=2662265 RepID=UPI001C608A9F|nr:AraC family transcriptional regulator [Cohnella sp. CFH 77786]MBW5444899.1 helix-turn-helix domain-containing protein [Cohnella sp. CFH 77786]
MNFQQFVAIIPIVERIDSSHDSQTVELAEDLHALIVVRHGHLSVSARNREPVVCSQGYACHPLYGPFSIQVPKTKDAEYVVIAYRTYPENSPWTLHGPLSMLSETKIRYMLDELLRTIGQIRADSAEEEAVRQSRMRMMLERILFIFLNESRLKEAGRTSAAAIEETLSYINEHYMLKLTLPMLAERAGMSEGHYTVLFKRHTGTTLMHYLRRIRIEKAKMMFRDTRLSAKEIAHKVGFGDYFHFSRVFKKEAGYSPTEFLKYLSKI